jgi:beta-lactamase class A
VDSSPIESRIAEALLTFAGVLGVFATHIETGESLGVRSDQRFPTASTIKTAILVEAFHQAEAGTLSLATPVRLEDADKVGGSGVLSAMRGGTLVTLGDLLYLMTAISDNTATNLVLRAVGVAAVNARMVALGLRETRLYRPTFRKVAEAFPEEEAEYGLGSSTPREMAGLMERIANGDAGSSAGCVAMLGLLRKQQVRTMIPRLLPDDAIVGSKSGQDDEKQPDASGVRGAVRADAGVVDTRKGRYVIAIFARRVQDTRYSVDNAALVAGATVSRLVFDHFTAR